MWIKLPYGKFLCSFGRVAFVNNKFFITHLWPASKMILFSRHVNYNYFLFLSSYVRWLANNFTPGTYVGYFICGVLLLTAILRNKQARNTRFIKPISVKLTHAQTFFRGVVKDYLTAKYDLGEKTGNKCDPQKVAEDMRHANLQNGERRFSRDEVNLKLGVFFQGYSCSKKAKSTRYTHLY